MVSQPAILIQRVVFSKTAPSQLSFELCWVHSYAHPKAQHHCNDVYLPL